MPENEKRQTLVKFWAEYFGVSEDEVRRRSEFIRKAVKKNA